MPSVMSPHHSNPRSSDMALLDYLSSTPAPAPPPTRRKLARREQPLDPLLFTAVLAGSGQITRHHIGHGLAPPVAHPGSYAACDVSRPITPAAVKAKSPEPARVSLQAPRSERIKLEADVAATAKAVEPIVITSSTSTARRSSSSAVGTSPTKSRRRMSMDPSPISQVLQMASSPISRTSHLPSPPFTAASSSSTAQPSTGLLPSPSGRLQVKCMARTRVPTPHGELFLHLYHNSTDQKEHLALVYDPIQLDASVKALAPRGRREIRSRTLDAVWREGETEMERLVRGAYVGRLTSSGGQASTAPTLRGSQLPTPITEEPDILADLADPISAAEHQADQAEPDIKPLVRIHSECYTGETIGSMRCDCGEQLDEALRQIAAPQAVVPIGRPAFSRADTQPSSPDASPGRTPDSQTVPGRGVVVYMRQEGRGIGLLEKIRAYNLQDLGHDTVSANLLLGHGADERSYGVAAAILRDLGLDGDGDGEGVRLLTNNPEKVEGMAAERIRIVQRVGMVPRDWVCKHAGDEKSEMEYEEWRLRRSGVGLIGGARTHGPELEKYLKTKVERMGHLIEIPQDRLS